MSGVSDLTSAGKTKTIVSNPSGQVKNATTYYKDCGLPNTPPILEDIRIRIDSNSTHQFTTSDFLEKYQDVEGDLPLSVVVTRVPNKGTLKLNQIPVINGQKISFSQIESLSFTPAEGGGGIKYTNCKVQINDDGIAPNPFSVVSKITFDVIINEPPSVQDNSISIIDDESYTFKVNDFLIGFVDSQNDQPLQLQIQSLPEQGILRLDGQTLTVGQIIGISQAQLIRYIPTQNSFGTPVTSFLFAVSDEGSQEFSESAQMFINVNARPQFNGSVITLEFNSSFRFSQDFFNQRTVDPDEDGLSAIKIINPPAVGQLTFKGVQVQQNQAIPISSLSQFELKYTPIIGQSGYGYTTIIFQVRDADSESPAWSNANTTTVNVLEEVNEPPTVSNGLSFTIETSTEYSFTWAQFENEFVDPEGDPMQTVRIESLPQIGSLIYLGNPVAQGDEFTQAQVADLKYQSALVAPLTEAFSWSAEDSVGQFSNIGTVTATIEQPVQPAPDTIALEIAVGGCRVVANNWTPAWILATDFVELNTIVYSDELLTQRVNGQNQIHRIKQIPFVIPKEFVINSQGEITLVRNCGLQVSAASVEVAPGNCTDSIGDLQFTELFYSSGATLEEGTILYTEDSLTTKFNGGGNDYRFKSVNGLLIEQLFTIESNGEIGSADACINAQGYDGVLLVNDCSTSGGLNTLVDLTDTTVGGVAFYPGSLDRFPGQDLLYRISFGGENQFYPPGATQLIISSFLVKINNNGQITQRNQCSIF